MKKVKDSIAMQQKSDLSRGIALKNSAEARRLEDRIKLFESNLHQNLVDLDAEIMGLRLSPLLRRKSPPGRISPLPPKLDARVGSATEKTSNSPSRISPVSIYDRRGSSEAVITDLHNKTVIPSITVVQDGPNAEYQPGFLPKIPANSAVVVGKESAIRPPEREIRPHSAQIQTSKKYSSTENIPSSPTLEVPINTFQRSRSFGDKESMRLRPRSPRRVKDLEDMLKPKREPQTQRPVVTVNPKQELEDRIKKFLSAPNPHIKIPYNGNQSQNTGSPTESPDVQLNTDSAQEPSRKDSLSPSEQLSQSTSESPSLTTENDSLQSKDVSLPGENRKVSTSKKQGQKENADEPAVKEKKSKEAKEDAKEEDRDVKLERQDTTKMKERRTGTVDQPESLEGDEAPNDAESIPSATGIPALDNLLLARAIADAEGILDSGKGYNFDEVVRRRLEALLRDPPTQEEMRKIRYLRLPEDKIPDILASVFGNEDGSITSVSHGNLALKDDASAVDRARRVKFT